MKSRLTSQFRVFAAGILILAVLFYLFFDLSKHVPLLARANPFNVDPYDAVGSFGVLLALFAALITAMRAYRPYAGTEIPGHALELILRGGTVVIVSITVTLAADAIAVIRQLSETLAWRGGLTLIALMVALAILNTWAGRWVRVRMEDVARPGGPSRLGRVILIWLAGTAVLAVYPSAWDTGTPGAILTALLGMLVLFAAVWSLAAAIYPAPLVPSEDVLDDVGAIYGWLKGRGGVLAGLFERLELLPKFPVLRAALRWLNPRRQRWRAAVLGGALVGLALATAEAAVEGVSTQAGRVILVGSVFVGIGSAGVLVGYGLLGRFLGLFRLEPPSSEP